MHRLTLLGSERAWRIMLLVGLFGCTDGSGAGLWLANENPSVSGDQPASRSDGTDWTIGIDPGAEQRGTDQFINTEAANSGRSTAIIVPVGGDQVQISLVEASIPAAAKAILSDTLGLNFVVGEGVLGSITIQTTGPVSTSVLLELFEASLAANGAQIRKEGEVYSIVPGTNGSAAFSLAGTGSVGPGGIVVAPLKFISANEMTRLLDPLSEQGLRVTPDRNRNLLLLSGTTSQIDAALDALNLFDVDVLKGKSVALVRLRSADPEAVVKELISIFESEEGGMLEGVVEFIPNPRLGSILVISSRANYLDKAERWIRELDQTAAGPGEYLEVYQLENRSASEVAPILNSLLGAEGASGSGYSEDISGEILAGNAARVSVVADDSRNSLIVNASRETQDQVSEILRSLDSVAKQVLLEATIAEVALTDEMNIGTRWFFESGNWDVGFSDLNTGAVAGNNPGFTAVFGVGGADVALSALASVTDVSVISAPTLMVVDNKEGVLQIGDQVPIATQNSSATAGGEATVVTSVDYRDTGIILRVKPRIGSGGRIMLDITQEVSDVVQNVASGIDSPTIRQRKIQTTVALGDGQTLALGGLVQQNSSANRTAVPGLGEIPIVGNLFRNKNGRKGSTELLILIRPRVVATDLNAADTTNYWRMRLSDANSVLASGLGSSTHTIVDYAE